MSSQPGYILRVIDQQIKDGSGVVFSLDDLKELAAEIESIRKHSDGLDVEVRELRRRLAMMERVVARLLLEEDDIIDDNPVAAEGGGG